MIDDPPDVQVLSVDGATRKMSATQVEVTRLGPHTTDLTEVLANKLRKRYHRNTVLVVLVEQATSVEIFNLHDFVRANNAHQQEIVIIGGTERAGHLQILRWDIDTPQ